MYMSKKSIKLVTDFETLETKEYPYPAFVKGSFVKRALELGAKMDKQGQDVDETVIDDLADFAVDLYGNKFTREELIDGTDATQLTDDDFTWESQKEAFDELVRELLKNGYKLNDIYEMDIWYFMDVMNEKKTKEKRKKKTDSLFSAFGR